MGQESTTLFIEELQINEKLERWVSRKLPKGCGGIKLLSPHLEKKSLFFFPIKDMQIEQKHQLSTTIAKENLNTLEAG